MLPCLLIATSMQFKVQLKWKWSTSIYTSILSCSSCGPVAVVIRVRGPVAVRVRGPVAVRVRGPLPFPVIPLGVWYAILTSSYSSRGSRVWGWNWHPFQYIESLIHSLLAAVCKICDTSWSMCTARIATFISLLEWYLILILEQHILVVAAAATTSLLGLCGRGLHIFSTAMILGMYTWTK